MIKIVGPLVIVQSMTTSRDLSLFRDLKDRNGNEGRVLLINHISKAFGVKYNPVAAAVVQCLQVGRVDGKDCRPVIDEINHITKGLNVEYNIDAAVLSVQMMLIKIIGSIVSAQSPIYRFTCLLVYETVLAFAFNQVVNTLI